MLRTSNRIRFLLWYVHGREGCCTLRFPTTGPNCEKGSEREAAVWEIRNEERRSVENVWGIVSYLYLSCKIVWISQSLSSSQTIFAIKRDNLLYKFCNVFVPPPPPPRFKMTMLYFQYNKFKQRIINDRVTTPTTTVYRCGSLIDLCRGPHVRHTGKIKAMAIIKVNISALFSPKKNKVIFGCERFLCEIVQRIFWLDLFQNLTRQYQCLGQHPNSKTYHLRSLKIGHPKEWSIKHVI